MGLTKAGYVFLGSLALFGIVMISGVLWEQNRNERAKENAQSFLREKGYRQVEFFSSRCLLDSCSDYSNTYVGTKKGKQFVFTVSTDWKGNVLKIEDTYEKTN